MKAFRTICIFLLAVASSMAADLASSFQQAVALAEAQEKAPATKDFFNQVLLPYYAQKYAPVVQSCFANVKQPDNSPFSFVAAIGSAGTVTRLYDDHETNLSQCLLATLKNDTFPAPPQSPYYLHIDMKFTDDPPATSAASTAGAPPLIVGPNKYSYTFGVPEGWEFNFEQARQHGAALAFFPKGGSFNESSSVIYVNELGDPCSDNCLSPLSQSIANTLREVKAGSPTVEITAAEPVRTKDRAKAAVRILKGAKDPRNPEFKDNEALAFIEHDETMILVVLTTRDPKTWDQDYAAFQQIVAGHKFFTCDSPNLAVPCRQ